MTETPTIEAYDAVIFDMDGVLVEPTDYTVLVDAVVEAFDSFGVDIDRAYAQQTIAEDAVPMDAIDEHGLDPEAFWHTRELTASLAQQHHVREGCKPVYDDISALDALDVPLALVSNNQHATVEFIVAYHGLDYFETTRGRLPSLDGAARRKPDPGYIEDAMAALETTDALYIGDSEKDIVAATRADIDSAFIRREHVADVNLTAEPTFEVPDLDAFVATLTEQSVGAAD